MFCVSFMKVSVACVVYTASPTSVSRSFLVFVRTSRLKASSHSRRHETQDLPKYVAAPSLCVIVCRSTTQITKQENYHRDQLRAQHSVTSMREGYHFKLYCNDDAVVHLNTKQIIQPVCLSICLHSHIS